MRHRVLTGHFGPINPPMWFTDKNLRITLRNQAVFKRVFLTLPLFVEERPHSPPFGTPRETPPNNPGLAAVSRTFINLYIVSITPTTLYGTWLSDI